MSEALVEHRWTVSPADAARAGRLGPRLDDFLADHVPLLSRMHLQSSIRSGAVLVDGRNAPPGLRLHAGAQIEAWLDPQAPSAMAPETIPIEIVWESPLLAVVVKPAGMLVHPTRGVKSGTLANALSGLWNQRGAPFVRPVFVHRLDKETSGLMVVAKSREAGARVRRRAGREALPRRPARRPTRTRAVDRGADWPSLGRHAAVARRGGRKAGAHVATRDRDGGRAFPGGARADDGPDESAPHPLRLDRTPHRRRPSLRRRRGGAHAPARRATHLPRPRQWIEAGIPFA